MGALVLLLTGEPGPSRRAAALAVFLLLTGSFHTGSFHLLALASLMDIP